MELGETWVILGRRSWAILLKRKNSTVVTLGFEWSLNWMRSYKIYTLRHFVNLGRANLSLVMVASKLCKLFISFHVHKIRAFFVIFRRLRATTFIGLELFPEVRLPKIGSLMVFNDLNNFSHFSFLSYLLLMVHDRNAIFDENIFFSLWLMYRKPRNLLRFSQLHCSIILPLSPLFLVRAMKFQVSSFTIIFNFLLKIWETDLFATLFHGIF